MALVIPCFEGRAVPSGAEVTSFLESGLLLAGSRCVVLPPLWNLPPQRPRGCPGSLPARRAGGGAAWTGACWRVCDETVEVKGAATGQGREWH